MRPCKAKAEQRARPFVSPSSIAFTTGSDPFASYATIGTASNAATDALPDGWGSDHPYFKEYIDLIRPSRIVEVGTWLGGSAVHMGRLLRAAGLNDSCIICVDTWLGSSEHFLNAPERRTLKLANGRATFYDDFMRNVVRHGLNDLIVPFSITSVAAAEVFREIEFAPDLIYIDGDHTVARFSHRSRIILGHPAARRRADRRRFRLAGNPHERA